MIWCSRISTVSNEQDLGGRFLRLLGGVVSDEESDSRSVRCLRIPLPVFLMVQGPFVELETHIIVVGMDTCVCEVSGFDFV